MPRSLPSTRIGGGPNHPALGAEVAGVDLAAPLDDSTRDALTRALADHLARECWPSSGAVNGVGAGPPPKCTGCAIPR